MGYRMDLKDADRMFAKLQEEYEIWAPKRFVGKGRYSDTDLIKYARVDRAEKSSTGKNRIFRPRRY